MGVVADMAHTVCVMKEGQIVEQGSVDQIFSAPTHEYTRRLLRAVPRLGTHTTQVIAQTSSATTPLVSVTDLRVEFPVRTGLLSRSQTLHAVAGVSFSIQAGETLALVGESGCGKTTLGQALLGLTTITHGEVCFEGVHLSRLSRADAKLFHRHATMIFQDPFGSLNPRMRVRDIIAEPLRVHQLCRSSDEERHRVEWLLRKVGLTTDMAGRYPHEFSGGQRQRIGIARALALNPRFIVCDEPTSALDVSIQAEMIELLNALKRELGLTLLFISHALGVVEQVADRVAVMYLGRIVEIGTTAQVIGNPQHPYTQALINAAPIPDPAVQRTRPRVALNGAPASAINPPSGCVFHPRCPQRQVGCDRYIQQLTALPDTRQVACEPLRRAFSARD